MSYHIEYGRISKCNFKKYNFFTEVIPAEPVFQKSAPNTHILNYKFPEEKLDSATLTELKSGKPLTYHATKKVVHIIVDDVKNKLKKPLLKDFKSIAYQVNEMYPSAIVDTVDNKYNLGENIGAFIQKLHHRYEHLRKLTEASTSSHDSAPKSKKRKASETFGCKNWLPQIDDGEGLIKLKECIKTMQLADDEAKIKMGELYPLLRKEICDAKNLMPVMSQFKQEWPHLFRSVVLRDHFEKLTKISLFEVADLSLRDVAGDVLRLSNNARNVEETKEIMNDLKKFKSKGCPKIIFITSIRLLFSFFKEKLDSFILVQPVSQNSWALVLQMHYKILLVVSLISLFFFQSTFLQLFIIFVL